jgi:glycosyltransferase involved in cell wall biosynthesis
VAAEKVGVLGPGSSNGVDVNRFIPTPARSNRAADLRRNLKLSSGPVIGYVGRFTTDKGIRELVAAFDLVRAEFCHASLLMIGSYEKGDILDPEVRTRIESGDGIVAIPFQSDITSYYLAMDVFVLPTYREGFPNTVLEAQAAERPVVTTTATGAADSIVDGKTGVLVPWGDASALATAIRRLLANPAEARRMGQAGRERVEREFRQEMVWANLSELYMTLLRQRGLTVPPIADNGEGLCLQKQ